MNPLQAERPLGPVVPNLATLLHRNAERFAGRTVFRARNAQGNFEGITWERFHADVLNIAHNLRHRFGFKPGDKLGDLLAQPPGHAGAGAGRDGLGRHRRAHLRLLPHRYRRAADRHCGARFLAVAGELQLARLGGDLGLDRIFVMDPGVPQRFAQQHEFAELLAARNSTDDPLHVNAGADEIRLNMYTSGTMGVPKCVQLTHGNILSQQAALDAAWNIGEHDRFLSYLPWHHSFGGIFELFSALSRGATYALETSYGKDPQSIFRDWQEVRPTVFFSVPKVYQALFELARASKENEDILFHPELKFVFTAAAALPEALSNEFEKRKIPVIEGWGLTETAPCCTLTDPRSSARPAWWASRSPACRCASARTMRSR